MQKSWLDKYHLLIFDKLDSTNSEALRLAKVKVEGEYIIWAGSQTAGKGTYGKKWHSPNDNFYLSLLLSNIPIEIQHHLSFVAAVAVYETVKEYCNNHSTPLELAIKWPNDILINNKKFSGILLEAISIFDKQYIVVGVGINIKYMPSDTPYPVTSLLSEGIVIQDISQVLDKFMINFEYYLSTWKKQGFMYIRQEWMQRAYKLHDIVTIKDGKNRISGEFKDIDFNGAIRIELASGAIYSLSSGELFVTAKCG